MEPQLVHQWVQCVGWPLGSQWAKRLGRWGHQLEKHWAWTWARWLVLLLAPQSGSRLEQKWVRPWARCLE